MECEVLSRVSDSGRFNVPASLRKMVGLESGGPVVVRVEGGELRIRTVRDLMTELQGEARALFAGSGESVEGFLEGRRAEAAGDGEG